MLSGGTVYVIMRNILILILILAAALGISLFFYLDATELIMTHDSDWKIKDKEIRSRLISIPILLYHNIDGSGSFSIDYQTIRSHFQLIKNRNIRVIHLKDLIERLEQPVPFNERVIAITFDDGFLSMYTKLLPLVKEFGFPVTLFVYIDFIKKESSRGLTWRMLRDMDANGIDIQAHTITHDDLTDITGGDEEARQRKLFDEIYISKRILELNLGKEISFFAFPYGKYNLSLLNLANKAGYRRVFSTDYGSNVLTRDNYCLRRQHIKKNYSLRVIDKIIR